MTKTTILVLGLALTTILSGCGAVLIGGIGAIAADEAMERENGGDGLF